MMIKGQPVADSSFYTVPKASDDKSGIRSWLGLSEADIYSRLD